MLERVLLVLVLTSSSGAFILKPDDICVPPCQCSQSSNQITCDNRNINTIPVFNSSVPLYSYMKLDLSYNDISHVSGDAFAGLNLTELDLSNNPIQTIDDDAFLGQQGLTKLEIQNAQLTSLPTSLALLYRLRYLDLRNNNIGSINTTILQGVGYSLEYLNLDGNSLGTWPGSFSHLHYLTFLGIGRNNISHFPANAFDSFTDTLRTLELYGKGLTVLPDALRDLKNLSNIVLYSNELGDSGFPKGIFDNSKSTLTRIDLQATGVTHVPIPIRNLTSLQYLTLTANRIEYILSADLENLKKLTHLYLDINRLTRIPSAVKLVPALEFLTVAYNPIHTVEFDDLRNMQNLKEFHLYESGLFYIAPRAFEGCSNLQRLVLYNNNLTSFPEAIKMLTVTNETDIAMEHNPVECSCSMSWIQDWIGNFTFGQIFSDTFVAVKCRNNPLSVNQFYNEIVVNRCK